MNFVESLALYSDAQRVVAYGFIICGIVLLASAALTALMSPNTSQLWQGLKVGALVFGLLITVGGLGYHQFSTKIEEQVAGDLEAKAQAAIAAENVRMQIVLSDYQVYQYVFAGIAVLALSTIVFGSSFWAGVSYPVAFLFLTILLIEAHSKQSIDEHADKVSLLFESAKG